MRIYRHFTYTGKEQRFVVPEGVTEALFECWGAAGGMPSTLAFEGKKREVVGGSGPRNDAFFNNPYHLAQLGTSFANGAGYAAGIKTVTAGDVYYIFVGGNGGPGHSTIKLKDDGVSYEVAFRGGAGGYNGGGDGGKGAHVFQNLYDSTSTKVQFKRSTIPGAAKTGDLWHDTANHLVKKCNHTYTSAPSSTYWDTVTHTHSHAAGPSGGGGGGATDVRFGGDATSNRILVAGGGGGAAGTFNVTGVAAWTLRACPGSPTPPFGNDDTGTGATGPDSTWATAHNYLVGGWGGGGIGGASGPHPATAPTTDGGSATTADSGGPGTDRHKDGTAPGAVNGSGGKGGSNVAGGAAGHGGSGQTAGSKGQGGTGADADGGYDDWCAGGGGGGGGYYGGGGGGQGFKSTGADDGIKTRAGGGGGGSNYVDPAFTQFFLAGCAQPPFAKSNSGTGANGLGGFARVSFHLPPTVKWTSAFAVENAGAPFTVGFQYAPAVTGGKGISHYIIGTATSPTATFPTSQTTYMVSDSTQTDFTATFTAPANGVTNAFFVQVVDTDGDASAWLKQTVQGLTAPTPQTITSPAAGSAFENSVVVNWTLGGQSPLVAYRLGCSGQRVTSFQGAMGITVDSPTGWRRGGSRVNLATDPGFVGTAVWSSTSNVNLAASTDHPGVSGSCGKIAWNVADDGSAEEHTKTFDNLVPDTTYRLHLEITSALANDPKPVEVQVYDANGLLTSVVYDLSTSAAGTYVAHDIEFTPHTQGVYVTVRPAGAVASGDPLYTGDFEDGTTTGWSVLNSHTVAADNVGPASGIYQGAYSLHVSGNPGTATYQGAQLDITSLLTLGAGNYVVTGWGWSPTGSDHTAVIRVTGAGVTGPGLGQGASNSTWNFIKFGFHWDGTGAVTLQVDGDGVTNFGGKWYDFILVSPADNTAFGSPDSGQVNYLANMLLELKYEEDATAYGAYFDGSHLNGLTGTVSWRGTANASESYLTGTDILTGTLAYSGAPLSNGTLYLDTLNRSDICLGHPGVRASEAITVNPSAPAAPVVTLTVNSDAGLMQFSINANDGAAAYKTVYFDVLRNGTRIATGLVPDQATRLAAYTDIPASGEVATYTVRAFDAAGGWADTTTGTVL